MPLACTTMFPRIEKRKQSFGLPVAETGIGDGQILLL